MRVLLDYISHEWWKQKILASLWMLYKSLSCIAYSFDISHPIDISSCVTWNISMKTSVKRNDKYYARLAMKGNWYILSSLTPTGTTNQLWTMDVLHMPKKSSKHTGSMPCHPTVCHAPTSQYDSPGLLCTYRAAVKKRTFSQCLKMQYTRFHSSADQRYVIYLVQVFI